jgi:hypothetical protein
MVSSNEFFCLSWPTLFAGCKFEPCTCLRFSWTNVQADDPILVARNTVFFKTVEIVLHEGKINHSMQW